ncbi:MAG: DEAD/DEAH box helicase [Verrucomicrobiota bacterium]|nr:DEAD/DEAH box helicase [Verrucomicrobiota bacterium]
MISNGPARIFTHESVESWFFRLSDYNWEKQFCDASMRKGRDLYKKSQISGLDVNPEQIIFFRKVSREETYSVLEWKDNKLDYRTSVEDDQLGRAIAVAGLYELEELIAEIHENDPMINYNSSTCSECIVDQEGQNESNGQNSCQKAENEDVCELLIELSISVKRGLLATPLWKIRNKVNLPAIGNEISKTSYNYDGPALIRFTRESVEDGFVLDKKRGAFALTDWEKIGKFAAKRLKTWEEAFKLEYQGEASLIKRGPNEIDWEIEAKSLENGKMTLQDQFRLGNRKLSSSIKHKIGKLGRGTLFVPKQGLIRLKKEQIDDYEWWKNKRGKNQDDHWPQYMLFSFFNRKHLRMHSDEKLSKWVSSIRKIKSSKPVNEIKLLRSYQKQGVSRLNWLHKLGCHGLLADEMGLGKTIQALALIDSSSKNKMPDLVVCPASVVPVWVQEAHTHFPKIKIEVLKQGNDFSQKKGECLWVASYTQIRRHRSLLERVKFRFAVLDEAQMIKNPQAKVTQACLAIEAKKRLALSGTPLENTALDIWTIFRFLMPGLLGGRKEFDHQINKDSHKTHHAINRQIKPFVIRRMKEEVATELPPKIESEVPCVLNQEQRKAYKLLVNKGILEHGESLQAAVKNSPTHIFSLLTRLRQSCCDLRLLPNPKKILEKGAKEVLLLQKLNDLAKSGSKAIIFSQFTSYLSILEKNIRMEIPPLGIVKLTGNTRDRNKPVKSFQEDKGPIVMLASLKAAGLGVTMTAADYVFLMDPWWNPAVEQQAIDRAHRIGRNKPIFIYRFIAKGTIEERVRQLQCDKKEMFEQVIGDIEKPSSLLNHFTDLNDLIRLDEFNI